MGDEHEPGSDKVTDRTRAFEQIDAQVFPGPGRGATPSEAAASDWWGGPSPSTVDAYHRMFDVVERHRLRCRPSNGSRRSNGIVETTAEGEGPTCLTSAARAKARS